MVAVQHEVLETLFLCESKSLSAFIHSMQSHPTKTHQVVCERKEDAPAVRAYIFNKIQELAGEELSGFCGVSMFTMETLVDNLLSAFALPQFSGMVPSSILELTQRPFTDQQASEDLLKLTLLAVGLPQKELEKVGKYLACLADVPFPEGESFLKLLLQVQDINANTRPRDIPDIRMRQLLLAFQLLEHLVKPRTTQVANFCQELNASLFSEQASQNKEILRLARFNCPTLWVSAPRFCDEQQNSEFHQNDFPENVGSALFHFVEQLFSANKTPLWRLMPKISVDIPLDAHLPEQVDVVQCLNPQELVHPLQENTWIKGQTDAGLWHELSRSSTPNWELSEDLVQQFLQQPQAEVEGEAAVWLQREWDTFNQALGHLNYLFEVDRGLELWKALFEAYNIPEPNMQNPQLFKLWVQGTPIQVQELATKPLHPMRLFPNLQPPKQVNTLGLASGHSTPSFLVKTLLGVSFILIKQGVALEIPDNRPAENIYWRWLGHILSQEVKVRFHFFQAKQYLEQSTALHKTHEAEVQLLGAVSPGVGFSAVHPVNNPNFCATKAHPVTHFEDYVHCPAYYYYKHHCKLVHFDTPSLAPSPLESGVALHRAAQCFYERLKGLFPSHSLADYKQEFTQLRDAYYNLYKKMVMQLPTVGHNKLQKAVLGFEQKLNQECKASLSKLSQAFAQQSKVPTLFDEDINSHSEEFFQKHFSMWAQEAILQMGVAGSQSSVQQALSVGLARRAFLRFLREEVERSLVAWPQNFEMDIKFTLSGIEFAGRVDRVDKLLEDSYHIIDYKTSKPSDKSAELFIDLQHFKQKRKKTYGASQLSVQGALYSHAIRQSFEQEEKAPVAFSLLKLKSLDESVEASLTAKESTCNVESVYAEELEGFKSGNYQPKPLVAEQCNNCEFQNMCPHILEGQAHEH